MAQLSEKFEEYLATLTPEEHEALNTRVKARRDAIAPPSAPSPLLPNESQQEQPGAVGPATQAGLDAARKMGYLDADGNPITRSRS